MKTIKCISLLAGLSLLLSGCGETRFSADDGLQKAVGEDSLGAEDNSLDDASGAISQISLEDLLDLLVNQPAEAEAVVKENRCYISGGNGHGIDICLKSDKSALSQVSPIEIKKVDQLCVPVAIFQERPELFAGGRLGRCDKLDNI